MPVPGAPRFLRCPKCGHRPLPEDQSLPAACPACGVILAKVAAAAARPRRAPAVDEPAEDGPGLADRLLQVPERVDALHWWLRAMLLAVFAVWGWVLIAQDYRVGEIGGSFLHGPLLLFHEAGHVLFIPFGHALMVAGGTLLQLLLPLALVLVLLLKQRDPFGAAFALWLLGVSLLDVAPYVYDALQPQLMLLSGAVGEEGGHDWIYLLDVVGWRSQARMLGTLIHRLGALVVLVALAWAAWLLVLQRRRLRGDALSRP